jgi:hypothetical protein
MIKYLLILCLIAFLYVVSTKEKLSHDKIYDTNDVRIIKEFLSLRKCAEYYDNRTIHNVLNKNGKCTNYIFRYPFYYWYV